MYTGKTEGGGGEANENFSAALYYVNTWNRLESGRFGPPFPATIKGAESQEPITPERATSMRSCHGFFYGPVYF